MENSLGPKLGARKKFEGHVYSKIDALLKGPAIIVLIAWLRALACVWLDHERKDGCDWNDGWFPSII